MAFFTAAGRLRRRDYFLRIPALYALGLGIYAIPGLLYAAEIPALVSLTAFVALLAVGYLTVIQALLRLHDLDLRGWWVLVAFLPVVSYVLGAGLQFVRGSIGPNRFGLDPKRPCQLPPSMPPVNDETDYKKEPSCIGRLFFVSRLSRESIDGRCCPAAGRCSEYHSRCGGFRLRRWCSGSPEPGRCRARPAPCGGHPRCR